MLIFLLGPEITSDPHAERARAEDTVQEGVSASNKASLGGVNAAPTSTAQRDGTNSIGDEHTVADRID